MNVMMDGKALLANNKVSLECNDLVSVIIMVNEINQTDLITNSEKRLPP